MIFGRYPRSAGEGADLDQVVCQDCLSGPDSGSFQPVQAGAVPSVSPLEAADPALAAGSPLHRLAERRSVFGGLPGLARSALAGNADSANAQGVQLVLDTLFAVAAVGGDGARAPPGAGDPPDADRPRRLDRWGPLSVSAESRENLVLGNIRPSHGVTFRWRSKTCRRRVTAPARPDAQTRPLPQFGNAR